MDREYSNNSKLLIEDFNHRDPQALDYVFRTLYDAIYLFTTRLYANLPLSADDAIQDAFFSIYKNKKFQFQSEDHLKAYLYLTIKNRFRREFSRNKLLERYTNVVKKTSTESISDTIVSSEIIAHISHNINLLPQDCARVIRLLIEGYSPVEISELTGAGLSTVYKRKNKAIEQLRESLSQDSLKIFLTFL